MRRNARQVAYASGRQDRLLIATVGAWFALELGGNLTHVFLAQGIALAAFGLITAGVVVARSGWRSTGGRQ